MSDTMTELREGDIYRWSYRDSSDNRYHCCSRIAVVKNGMLRDTYWQVGNSFSDGRWFGIGALPALDLKFIGNFSELEAAQEYQADYYDDADIVDLNHANSTRGNFYLRKGAIRSQKKMLESARQRLQKSLDEEQMAAWRSERLRASIARIEAGDMDTHI